METDNQAPTQDAQPQSGGGMQDFAQQSAAGAPSPAPNQAPQGQPAPTNQPTQPTQPKAQSPQDFHQGLFKNIFETLAGGPKYHMVDEKDPSGNPTGKQVAVRVPQSKKALGASILAGAISGMMAGMAAPDKFNANGGRDLSPSAQAGQEVGNKIVASKGIAGAKAMDDEDKARAYNIVDHNLKLQVATMNAKKLQGEEMDSALTTADPIRQAMEAAAQDNPNLVIQRNVSEDQLHKIMDDGTGHVTRDSVVPDGKVEVFDKDGQPTGKYAYTYTIYNPNAVVKATEDLKKTDKRFAAIANGQNVPVRVFADAWRRKMEATNAQGFINKWVEQNNDAVKGGMKGKKIDEVKVDEAVAKDPYLAQLLPMLGKYADEDPASALASMRQNGVDSNLLGRFAKLLNVDTDAWKNYNETEKKDAENANNPDKQPVDKSVLDTFPQDIKTGYPNLTDGQVSLLQKELGSNPTQGNYKQVLDRAEKYSHALGDQDAAVDTSHDRFDAAGVNVGFLETLPAEKSATIKALGEGRNEMSAGMLRTKEGQKLVQAVNRAYPDWDASQSASYAKSRTDFTSGKTSAGMEALNVAMGHAGKMFKAVNLGSTVPGVSDIRSFLGAKDVSEVTTGKQLLRQELARAYKNGVADRGDVEDMEKLLDTWSPAKLKTNLATVAEFLDSKIAAVDQKWQNAVPKYMTHMVPMTILSKSAAGAYKEMTGKDIEPIIYGRGSAVGSDAQPPAGQAGQGKNTPNPADEIAKSIKLPNGANAVKIMTSAKGTILAWDGKSPQWTDTGIPASSYHPGQQSQSEGQPQQQPQQQ